MINKTIKTLILTVSFCVYAISQTPGTLDNTFGTVGKVILPIGTGNEIAYAVEIQTDGKIVAAGYSKSANEDVAVVRLNSNGTLDNTFGNGGKVIIPIGSSTDFCYAMKIQSDGKIVVGGGSVVTGFGYEWYLARLDTNGVLDNTFGNGGIVITTGNNQPEYIYAIVQQASGKLVAGGGMHDGAKSNFTLVRYNNNGSIDDTFGSAGKVVTDFGGFASTVKSIKLLENGSIIAAGSANNGVNNDFAAAKYDSNGVLDNSFGTEGKVLTPVGSADDFCNTVELQDGGKVILGGSSRIGTINNYAMVRYTSNGNLDNTFGNGGKLISGIGTDTSVCYALKYVKNFGILAAGRAKNGTNTDFSLVLYDSIGNFVNSFGSSGTVFIDFLGFDWAYGIDIQKDGKIVLAGFGSTLTNADWAIARLHGQPPTSVREINGITAQYFNLNQNYPNPFNPSTIITWQTPLRGWHKLKIFDLLGTEIAELVNEWKEAGSYEVEFTSPKELANGVYIYRLQIIPSEGVTGNYTASRKMLIIK